MHEWINRSINYNKTKNWSRRRHFFIFNEYINNKLQINDNTGNRFSGSVKILRFKITLVFSVTTNNIHYRFWECLTSLNWVKPFCGPQIQLSFLTFWNIYPNNRLNIINNITMYRCCKATSLYLFSGIKWNYSIDRDLATVYCCCAAREGRPCWHEATFSRGNIKQRKWEAGMAVRVSEK